MQTQFAGGRLEAVLDESNCGEHTDWMDGYDLACPGEMPCLDSLLSDNHHNLVLLTSSFRDSSPAGGSLLLCTDRGVKIARYHLTTSVHVATDFQEQFTISIFNF